MNTLPASLLNSATPSVVADAARANNARTQAASGSFSQLLRGFDKPPVMESKPSLTDAAPKPSAESAAQHASTTNATSDGKTETQRQEAKLKPAAKRDEPSAPKVALGPTASAEADAASTAAPSTDDSLAPTEAQARADADTAELGKTAKAAKITKAVPAEDPPAAAALPAAAQPLPLPTTLSQPPALPTADKLPPTEGGLTSATDAAVSPKSAVKAAASVRNAEATPGTDTAASDTADEAAKASDFASLFKDAAQAAPELARTAGETTARPAAAAIDGLLSAAATQGAHTPTAGRSGELSSAPVLSLAHPLYEAGFAPELAARLSVLAADGVQEAQLHLNPADMGPVAVQIVVEGQQAHISFHADQADTRAVLERSLPDLAAALRDSGLTLSGGGVFQQSAGQDRQAEASNARAQRQQSRDVTDALPSLGRAAPPVRPSRGVVDLYA